MIMPGEYAELLARGKAIQRDAVVRLVFRSQTRLARILGVLPETVNHVVWGRKRSRRIEEYVAAEVKRVRPDLLDCWLPDRNGQTKKIA